jgi:hypothetical protein
MVKHIGVIKYAARRSEQMMMMMIIIRLLECRK